MAEPMREKMYCPYCKDIIFLEKVLKGLNRMWTFANTQALQVDFRCPNCDKSISPSQLLVKK